MTQLTRYITDLSDGFLCGKRYLILNRDAKYAEEYREMFLREGIDFIRLQPKSPN